MANNQDDYQSPLAEGITDSKTYRRFVASSSVDKTDNLAAWNNEMNDAIADLKKPESAGVQDKKEPLSRPVQALATALLLLALVLAVVWLFSRSLPFLIGALVLALGRIAIEWHRYQKNQRAWLERTKK